MGFFDAIISGLSKAGKTVASNPELLKGVGAIANAWGSYEVGKKANKIALEQLAYDRARMAKENAAQEKAQAGLEGALSNIYGMPKKKKKDDLSNAWQVPVL